VRIAIFFKKYSKYLGILAAIVISVLIFVYRDELTFLRGYGYIGIFILSILGSATIISPAPVFLLAFSSGGVFSPIPVAFFVSLGSAIGEITGYLVGVSGGDIIKKHKRLKRIEGWMKINGIVTIFVLAAIPNFLFDVAGIVAGSSKIPVRKFLIATWLGRLVRYLILAYLGSKFI
jgi:membrane protein YqaA with SNARE-associated domain